MAKSNTGIIALVGIAGAGLLLTGKKKSSGKGKPVASADNVAVEEPTPKTSSPSDLPTPVGDPREGQGIGEEDLPEVGGELEGEFETESEDAGFGPDEDAGGVAQGAMHGVEVKPDCVSFMEQIFAPPGEQIDDSIPIRPGVVNETIIPVMGDAMGSVIQGFGSPDTPGFGETAGPLMVLEALKALVPICEWSYDETSGQFLFNGAGDLSSSAKAGGVLNGLFELSSRLIDLKIAAGGEGEPPDGAQSGPSSPSSMDMGQPGPTPADIGP
jgi:hypothetical protein